MCVCVYFMFQTTTYVSRSGSRIHVRLTLTLINAPNQFDVAFFYVRCASAHINISVHSIIAMFFWTECQLCANDTGQNRSQRCVNIVSGGILHAILYGVQLTVKHSTLTNSLLDGDSAFFIVAPTLFTVDSLFEIDFSFSVLKRWFCEKKCKRLFD